MHGKQFNLLFLISFQNYDQTKPNNNSGFQLGYQTYYMELSRAGYHMKP